MFLLFCFALSCFLAGILSKKVFTVDDMTKMHRLNGVSVNCDGTFVAYIYTTFHEESGTTSSALHISAASGDSANKEVQLFDDLNGFGDLNWDSTDPGKLYFTASDKTSSVSRLYMYTLFKKYTPISDLPVDMTNVIFSPDMKYVVFTTEVFVSADSILAKDRSFTKDMVRESLTKPLEFAVDYQKRLDDRKFKAFTFDKSPFRRWDTQVTPGKWIHPIICTVSDNIMSDDCIDILRNYVGDSPIRPFNDASTAFTFSEDSSKFYYITQQGKDANLSTDDSVYEVVIEDAFNTQKLLSINSRCVTPHKGRDARPRVSRGYLYTITMFEEKSEADLATIVRWDLKDGNSKVIITKAFDRGVDSFEILEDNDEKITFAATFLDTGRLNLYTIGIQKNLFDNTIQFDEITIKGAMQLIQKGGSISQYFFLPNNRIMTVVSSFMYPLNIMVKDIKGTGEEPATHFTHFNDIILNELYFSNEPCNELWIPSGVEGEDGKQIHSFYFPPNVEDFNPNDRTKKYPIIMYIHGGPESPWDDGWSYRWNPLVIASQGYALIATNFHGSSSFGDAFTKSIREHWFDYPVNDTISALQVVLNQYEYLDSDRIAAMGASYGGTHVNWLIGHNDIGINGKRIKCFISHDGIYNLEAFGLETDETYFVNQEMGNKNIYENPKGYYKWNPMRSMNHANPDSPVLIIHGGMDYRIQEYQSVALFQTLLMYGVDAKYVYFPTQSHWVYKPLESKYWHAAVFDFLEENLKKN